MLKWASCGSGLVFLVAGIILKEVDSLDRLVLVAIAMTLFVLSIFFLFEDENESA